jgi:molybdenum cofactor biosynthesis enzyme MoaA
MPEDGLVWLSCKELMTCEEMLRTCSLLVKMGIKKIRITGGEPFVRKDIMQLLTEISEIEGLKELSLTTNGILTTHMLPNLGA